MHELWEKAIGPIAPALSPNLGGAAGLEGEGLSQVLAITMILHVVSFYGMCSTGGYLGFGGRPPVKTASTAAEVP